MFSLHQRVCWGKGPAAPQSSFFLLLLVCSGSPWEKRWCMNSCREPGQQLLPVSLCWHSAALERSLYQGRTGTQCGAGQSPAGLDGKQGGTPLSWNKPAGPSSNFLLRVLCQEGLNCTFSETQVLKQLLASSFQTSLQFLK